MMIREREREREREACGEQLEDLGLRAALF
jgi:hypothetical protein